MFCPAGLYVSLVLRYKSENHHYDKSLSDAGDCDKKDGDNSFAGLAK